MMKKITVLIISVFLLKFAAAQSHEHDCHVHEHKDWELGVAVGGVSLLSEDEIGAGLHFHILRKVEKFERLRIGLGVENIIDEHTHLNGAVVISYSIWKGLGANVSPGLLFVKHHDEWERDFSSHFEILYEFEVGKLHLGPLVEYAWSKHDKHLLFGAHLGIGF